MSFSVRRPHVLLVLFFVLLALLAAFGLSTAVTAQLETQADQQAPVSMQSGVSSAAGHKPRTVTDAQGAFRFEGLARGTHQLYLDPSTLPADLRPSAPAPEHTLWLNPGQTLLSDPIGRGVRISATYDPAGSVISGVVFVDQNHDGRRSPGERGLAGVTVIDPTIHQYFIPFDDLDLIELLRDSNACQGQQGGGNSVGNFVASRISLTASSNGTIFYYDHWEDGYDADPQQPGPTTLVGALEAGQTRIFEDDVNTADPNWGTTLYFDGRDRISVFGEPASVIRAASPGSDSTIGTRLAGAWEIDQAANWGRAYVVPAGEDWGAGADFEFTGATVTAFQNGTQVFLNGALLDPAQPMINAGQTVFENGAGDGPGGFGLDSGDVITATGPIEVHLYGSLCTFPSYWSGNGYTLEPRDQWNSDYWSPVPRRTASATCNASADTDIFLYNDTDSAFDVTIDDGTPNTVSLPPGSSSVVALNGPLSDSQGVHVFAPGGQPFWGVANFDTRDIIFEWGYSLIPSDELSSQVVFGWAPGNDLEPPIFESPPSGNLAFVTAITNTVVFADFDQDGNPDMMDCNGDGDFIDPGECAGFDEIDSINGITLLPGQALAVADPYDADLTGALLYTSDLSEKIAVAWGEDSCVADVGVPYLDMGYTVLPIGVPSISKADTLVVDVDMSGDTTPGDILEYTVLVANNGRGVMNNVVLTDVLPYTHTDFVAFSIDVSLPPPTGTYAYDDGSGLFNHTLQPTGDWDVDPAVQQFRVTWPQIEAGQTVSVTFRVQIEPDLPPDVREITNVALLNSDNTPLRSSEDPDDPNDPDTDTPLGEPPILWLNKLPSDPTTVTAGGYLTYTIVVSNVGNGTAVSALVLDNLPPWLTYVPDTLDLTLPVAQVISTTTPVTIVSLFDDTYGDNFDDASHTLTVWPGGNDGTLAWTAPISEWIELGDDGNQNTGDVQVVNTGARTPPGALQLNDGDTVDVESGAMRCADLSDFVEPHLRFQMQGDTSAGPADTFRVVITNTTSAAVTSVTEQRNAATYVLVDIDLSAHALQPEVCVSFVTDVGLDPDDFYRIDDVEIYENAPLRSEVIDRVDRTTSVSYSAFTNINPVTYTRILPDPTTIAITHTMNVTDAFPFPPQSRLTTTFQVQVGYPLTDGLQMINTASITATNLISTPYPLQDSEPTLVQSNHVLTVTKIDGPDPVPLSQLLTYTLSWEVAGNEPAPGVVVSDILPLPYVSFVSCDPLPACQGETAPGSGVVTWDLGNRLPPMSQITRDGGTLTLTVRVDSRPPNGVFTNTVFIDDETDTPIDRDDEPTRVPLGGFALSKQRLTTSPITVTEQITFLIAITNTGAITITSLPLEDTYDPFYLGYVDALPPPDTVSPGSLTWSDLTVNLPGAVLPPGASTQVIVHFVALTVTQNLTPPVTINTAVSEGAETETGEVLPRQEDDDDVGIVDEIPDAIQLLYFRAYPKADGVLVQWATLLEINTYGFWLYRSDDANLGHAVPVAFVAAEGWGGLGAAYQYLDGDLPPGLYHYWLVEVENGGTRTTYGPTSAWSGSGVGDLPYRIYLPLIRQP